LIIYLVNVPYYSTMLLCIRCLLYLLFVIVIDCCRSDLTADLIVCVTAVISGVHVVLRICVGAVISGVSALSAFFRTTLSG